VSDIETQSAPEVAEQSSGGAPDSGSVDSALRALAASKGFAYGGEEPQALVDTPDPDEAKATPEPVVPDAPKSVAAKEVPLEKYARIEAKAREAEAKARAAEQRAAEAERRWQEEEAAWKADPLVALHRRGLSTIDLNKRALDLGEPAKEAPKAEELPAWAAELKRQNDELIKWREQQVQREQQTAQQQAVQAQVDILKCHLGKFDEFSLVNDLGEHGEVLRRVSAHLAGGRFEDDEQAATVIAAIAREREAELQAQYREALAKPKLRAFLERELRGSQSEESPARRDSQGNRGARNPARAALSNEPAQQRTQLRPPADEREWSREDAMRRALEEVRPLTRAS
jgi:hypothetical protein